MVSIREKLNCNPTAEFIIKEEVEPIVKEMDFGVKPVIFGAD